MKGEEANYDDIKEEEKRILIGKRKKQIDDKLHTEENIRTIKSSKKPLRRLWILIIILVAVALIAGYNPGGIVPGYTPSWAYINYEIETFGTTQTIEENFPQDWSENDLSLPINKAWFELPAISFGKALFREDFTDVPNATLLGLISILIIGFGLIFFEMLDKKNDYSLTTYTTVQCILYTSMIIPAVYALSNLIKFVGSYLLMGQHYHKLPITLRVGGVTVTKFNSWVYPVPYFLIVISFIIITIAFTVMEADLKVILKEMGKNDSYKKSSFSSLWGIKDNV